MPFCKKCGKGVDTDSTFCKHCGASQVPAKPWIDPTLLVIVLVEIVVITVLGLWSGSPYGYVFATISIVANIAILGTDMIHRRPQRP